MKRFVGPNANWNGNSNQYGNRGSFGRGRSMTAPAWVQRNGEGFGSFQGAENASSGPVNHSDRQFRHFRPGNVPNVTSNITTEELLSPVNPQHSGSNSIQRDYQRT